MLVRTKLWDAAYSPQERYSQKDISDVVEYGRMRAVRVMVEFDMPGHAAAWCKGYPQVGPLGHVPGSVLVSWGRATRDPLPRGSPPSLLISQGNAMLLPF